MISDFLGCSVTDLYRTISGNVLLQTFPNEKSIHKELLSEYKTIDTAAISAIIRFHYKFERIHPFQDGNVTTRYQQKTA